MEAVLRFRGIVRSLLQEECAFEAIQLWCVPAFTSGVHKRQRFHKRRQSCFWLSHGSMCPSEQDRTVRFPEQKSLFHSEAHGGFGALLGDTSLAAELMEHGSPAQGKT